MRTYVILFPSIDRNYDVMGTHEKYFTDREVHYGFFFNRILDSHFPDNLAAITDLNPEEATFFALKHKTYLVHRKANELLHFHTIYHYIPK